MGLVRLIGIFLPLFFIMSAFGQELMNTEEMIIKYRSQLQSMDEDTRISALVGLRKIGARNGQVEEILISALKDKSGYVSVLAAEALSRENKAIKHALPVLIKALESPLDPAFKTGRYVKDWKRVAAGAIGNYGSDAAPAVPALKKALKHTDYNVRGYAAMSLGNIGLASKSAMPDLQKAISMEKIDGVKKIMIEALSKLKML